MTKWVFLLIIISLLFFFYFPKTDTQHYQISEGEQLVGSILGKTAKIIKNKYDLRPCGTGAAMPGGPIQELTLCFDTKRPHTKEQLRDLIIKSANELLGSVNQNNKIQKFIKNPPFTINNVQIVIYNHDEKGASLKDPQISVADISDGRLYYKTIDPEDVFKYKNKYKESYEEALQALAAPENT